MFPHPERLEGERNLKDMPTGYTAGILEGETFEQYALQCAKAFGALVMMRDEPSDAPIPDQFEPSPYYKEQLEKAKKEFARLNDLTKKGWEKEWNEQYELTIKSNESYRRKNNEDRAKYEAMLVKAKSYKAPTPDHQNYANFLVSQIEESIKFDCGYKYPDPIKLPLDIFISESLKKAQDNIIYYNKSYCEELDRIESRNNWIKELKKSLSI